jgi:dihydrofolate reductase
MPATGHIYIATSVDGYIARANGAIDWLAPYNEDTGYDTFIASIDGLVMGRGTFETALSFGAWPYDKPVVVLSRTLTDADIRADLAGKVRVSNMSPKTLMESLGAAGWQRAYVDGGKVIQAFLRDGLIADMVLTRIPVLLGNGIPLFGQTNRDIALRHVATRSYPSGLVQSTYAVG